MTGKKELDKNLIYSLVITRIKDVTGIVDGVEIEINAEIKSDFESSKIIKVLHDQLETRLKYL